MNGECLDGDEAPLFQAFPQRLFQMRRVLHQLLDVGVLHPGESVEEPALNGLVPDLPRIVVHPFQLHVIVVHLVGIGDLALQSQLRHERSYGGVDPVAPGHQLGGTLQELLEHELQLAALRLVVVVAVLVDGLDVEFQSSGGSGVDDVPPVLPLHRRRVDFIHKTSFLFWHKMNDF